MAPQTRSQSAAERLKRVRDASPERPSKRIKQRIDDQSQCPLFQYQFVLPLVLTCLYDMSAVYLVRTCKAMKPIISKFVLYRFVTQALADEISDPSRFSYFQSSIITSVTHGDLSKHRYMKHVRFDDRFNSPLLVGCFNDRVKSIKFGEDFNQSIDGVLPERLEDLRFGKAFNQPVNQSTFPPSITYLTFAGSFNQALMPGVLPSSLETLGLGRGFDRPILPGMLPQSLTHLSFRGVADQPLLPGSLPAKLETLDLGVYFDQPILPGVLPHGLTHLTLSYSFNHPLAVGAIPNTVTHLTFGECFDQVLQPGVIPSSVIELQWIRDYRQPLLQNALPNSIKHFIFCCNATECLNVGVLNSIEHLEVGHYEKYPLPDDEDNDESLILLPDMFPSSIKQLTIHRKCEACTVLPSTITKLVFGPRFNEQIPANFIPSSVTHLRFGHDFAQSLTPEMLPSSVKYLTLGESFEPRMLTPFPNHLTHLCFEKALSFDELTYVSKSVSKPMMCVVVNMPASPSGLLLRSYICLLIESGDVNVFTSYDPIDIENLDIANMKAWDMTKILADMHSASVSVTDSQSVD